MASSRPQDPRRQVGEFTIVRELGRGGMGVVYAATHPRLGDVALKVLLDPDPALVERFRREAQAAARLDHPGVVRVLECSDEGRLPFLAMRLVPGESLDQRLRRTGPLAEDEALRVAEALARALAHAHERGVVHRDVKTRNVVLELGTDAPVLVDFGVARLTGVSRLTATGELVGTPETMSPEQVAGAREVGPAADVHALGATLYTMLTGQAPFVGSGVSLLAQVAELPARRPSSRRPGLDPRLDALVLRCLEKDPAERPSAAALADALAACRTWRTPRRGRLRRARWPALAAVVAAAGTGTALLVFARGASTPEAPLAASTPPTVPVVGAPTSPPLRSPPDPAASPPPPPAKPSVRAERDDQREEARRCCSAAWGSLLLWDLAGALAHADAAVAAAPFVGEGWVLRANAHAWLGDASAVLESLDRAAAAEEPPTSPPGLIDGLRGVALGQLDRHEEALPLLERAYATLLQPPAHVAFCLGVALRKMGRDDDAIGPLRDAVANWPGLGWQGHFHLAGALRSTDLEECLAEYERARTSPNYRSYYAEFREGEVLTAAGRADDALALLNPILRSPHASRALRNAQYLTALANAHTGAGSAEDGLSWARRAIEVDPTSPQAHQALVHALRRLERLDDARVAVAEARRCCPDDLELQRLANELGP